MAYLYVEQFGNGMPLLFLHGWGMHRNLLRDFAMPFATHHTVCLVDMPGYGQSDVINGAVDIQTIARYLAEQFTQYEKYIVVGWSLGALVALRMAAMFPARVDKMVLFTATPWFMQSDTWEHGVAATALQQVHAELQQDYSRAMNRFLQLQLMNQPGAREFVRKIRELLSQEAAPQSMALHQGLQLLAETDLRIQLASITTPTLVINGDRDTLIPTVAARYLAENLPAAHAVVVQGAGHLPFISHASLCQSYVKEFLQ